MGDYKERCIKISGQINLGFQNITHSLGGERCYADFIFVMQYMMAMVGMEDTIVDIVGETGRENS